MAEPEPEDAEPAIHEGLSPWQAGPPPATVEALLRAHSLERYFGGITDAGYDELIFLREASANDVEELVASTGMKKPHAKKFQQAWQELRAETAAAASPRSPAVGGGTAGAS